MSTLNDVTALAGKTAYGAGGQKLGKIVDVYESTDGGTAGTFVTVATGLFGTRASFVPLHDAQADGDSVVFPYDKELVKDAPRVASDEELTSEEEERLYQHYSLFAGTDGPADSVGAGTRAAHGTEHARDTEHPRDTGHARDTVGHDTSGPTTDDAMTVSEERLQVGVERVEAGRARLRKRIVAHEETVTVPTSHEEVRVVREPVTEANRDAAYAGPALSEEEHEVVLHAETPVVTKETVAVERVRLDTETVTEQVRVDEQVRRERVEVDGVDEVDRADRADGVDGADGADGVTGTHRDDAARH